MEVGRAVDQLDQIYYGSDTQQQLAVQARPQEKPRLIKETTPEEEESWTQVRIAIFFLKNIKMCAYTTVLTGLKSSENILI